MTTEGCARGQDWEVMHKWKPEAGTEAEHQDYGLQTPGYLDPEACSPTQCCVTLGK